MKTHRKAQVWIAAGLTSEEKKILVFKVQERRGGGWHPVTGSVEDKESFFEAAIRETIEETGLDLLSLNAKWIDLEYLFKFEGSRSWQKGVVEERAFGLYLPVPSTTVFVMLDPKEHTEAKWVSAEEVLGLLSFPNQKAALEIFLKKLK